MFFSFKKKVPPANFSSGNDELGQSDSKPAFDKGNKYMNEDTFAVPKKVKRIGSVNLYYF